MVGIYFVTRRLVNGDINNGHWPITKYTEWLEGA